MKHQILFDYIFGTNVILKFRNFHLYLLGCHAVTTSFNHKIYLSIYTRVNEHILHVTPLGDVSRSIGGGWGGGLH